MALPLKVFLKTLATLLVLEAEDFVERLSESESDSGLLLDLVGRRMGWGLGDLPSDFSSKSSSFRGDLQVSDLGVGGVGDRFGGSEIFGEATTIVFGDLGDFGDFGEIPCFSLF